MSDVFGASPSPSEDPVGLFVRSLDAVLGECEAPGAPEDADATALKVEWMVRFSLAVAKVSR